MDTLSISNHFVTIEIDRQEDDIHLFLPAHFDEAVELPTLQLRLSQRIVFECEAVVYVNSFAMQKWIRWMRGLHPDTHYVFRRCHGKVIEMMNSVQGFWPLHAIVESFYMPYSCTTCDGEDEVLLTRGREYVEALGNQKPRLLYPNQINCSQCRQIMEVGVLESAYLRFLESKNT